MRRSPRLVLAGFACFASVFAACSAQSTDATPNEQSNDRPVVSSTTAPPIDEAGSAEGSDQAPETAPAPDQETQPVSPVPLEALATLPGEIVLLDSGERVVVTQPNGSSAEVLSVPGNSNSQPTWSSSGERVAWTSFGPDGFSLSTALSNGSDQRSSPVASPAFYLAWSPEDSWIGGLRAAGAGMEMFVASQSIDADDAALAGRQVSQAQPFYFEWGNDDAIVAALGNQLLVDISASNAVDPLRRPFEDPLGVFQAPAVLPNNDVLAALFIDNTNTLVRLAGTEVTEIATANGPIFIAASPNGQQVATLVPTFTGGQQQPESDVISFQFDEPVELDNGQVTVINLVTGDVTPLATEQVVSMSWSPDSSTLAVLGSTNNGLQWSFATETSQVDGAEFNPSTRFIERYLPFFDQYNLSSTPWSPDSTAVVFSGSIGDNEGVFVDLINDDGGPAMIADGDIAFWSPR